MKKNTVKKFNIFFLVVAALITSLWVSCKKKENPLKEYTCVCFINASEFSRTNFGLVTKEDAESACQSFYALEGTDVKCSLEE